MPDLLTEIYNALIAEPTINNIVQGRIYKNQPLNTPSGTFITYSQGDEDPNGVRQKTLIKFVLYSKDLEELQQLGNNLKDFLKFETTSIGGYQVYYVMCLGRKAITTPTNDKFYVALVDFDVYDTY